jgi:hypothetical protein
VNLNSDIKFCVPLVEVVAVGGSDVLLLVSLIDLVLVTLLIALYHLVLVMLEMLLCRRLQIYMSYDILVKLKEVGLHEKTYHCDKR